MIRALTLLPLLAACASSPMTVERALRECRADAGQADGVSGSVGAGVSNTGPIARGTITVTNRVLNPQTESDFVSDCIDRKLAGRPEPTTIGITVGGKS